MYRLPPTPTHSRQSRCGEGSGGERREEENESSKLIHSSLQAADFAMETAEMVSEYGRRSLDQLAAKVYFYLARAYELQARLSELQA